MLVGNAVTSEESAGRRRHEKKNQRSEARWRTPTSPSRFTRNVLAKGINDRLTADGRIQQKPCCVTIDTVVSVTIAMPDIIAGQLERKPSRPYILQTAFGETAPVVQVVLELTLGRHAL